MPFTEPGVQVYLRDDRGVLTAPLRYQGRIDHFVIPAGFDTDFASVPKRLQGLVQSIGKWTRAAIAHDWFCTGLANGDCPVSARDADGIFRRMMRESDVGFITRWCMWTAVRWAALKNPARRPGWIRDAPLVVAITAAVLTAAVLAAAGVAAYAVARLICHLT